MPSSLRVAIRAQHFNGRYGPNKVFGTDVDVRPNFTTEQAEERFMNTWRNGLEQSVESGTPTDVETVRKLLPERYQKYINENDEHRVLRHSGVQFIAQISDDEVNQLWYIPNYDENPKLLRIVFDTVEERQEFAKLAERLGWKDEVLGLALVTDFIDKHPKRMRS